MEHFYQKIQGMFSFPNLYSIVVNHFVGNDLHFVEIGSWKGRSAAYMAVDIINSNKNIKFDCVDKWTLSEEDKKLWCDGVLFDSNIEIIEKKDISLYDDDLYKTFLKNIEPIKNKINIIRQDSAEAAVLYKDNSLDFIFIDANHDYEPVKNDIISWYPKLKKNGIIAGHDYFEPCGVKQAVSEFFEVNRIQTIEGCWVIYP